MKFCSILHPPQRIIVRKAHTMDARKLTLENIFDPTVRLEAPLFQRPYVWNEKSNWQPLWEAIEQIAKKRFEGIEARPHFLGAVVLDQLKTPTGSVHARQIIDGQQRLTTLQVALAAIRDICKVSGRHDFHNAFNVNTKELQQILCRCNSETSSQE